MTKGERGGAGGGRAAWGGGGGTATAIEEFDVGDDCVGGLFALDGELIRQEAVCQLVVPDNVGGKGSAIFAGQLARPLDVVFKHGIGHFQADIALIAEQELECDGFAAGFGGDDNRVGCAAFGGLELDAARVRAQRIRVERGGGDGGLVRAAACEGKLILQEAVLELVVLDGEAGTAVCGAKRVAAGNRTFQPREFQLEIQPVLIGENEGIADGLAGGAGRDAEKIGFLILSVSRGHLQDAGLGQRARFAVSGAVVRADKFGGAGALAEEVEAVLEEAVGERVALDGACGGVVRAAGGFGGTGRCLPGEAKVEVEAGLQTEEEGKFHIRLDGFAVCGFLRNVGLQEKDVILEFRAVRQRHDDGAAGVDGAGDAVSGGEEGPGDAGVRCVEAGETQVIGKHAIVQLGEEDAFADGLAGGAGDGGGLCAVFIPRQGRAEVEIGKRERFIRFAGIARLFTFAAGIGISACADVQVGIVGLGGLLLRGGFGFGALAGFAVRLFRVGLLGFAGEIALCVAVCAGAGGVQTVAGAGMAGRIACLQDGDLLGFGLQNGVVWFGGAHPEQRQADAEHEGTDKQAAAQWAQPWKFGKESVHAYRPPQGGDCPSCDVVLGRHFSIQKPPISILKSTAKAPAGSLLLPGATGKSLAAAHTIRSEKAAVIQVF